MEFRFWAWLNLYIMYMCYGNTEPLEAAFKLALKDLVTILNVLNLHLNIVFCNYESNNAKENGINRI